MELNYKPPLKVHVFNRRWVLRDPQNKEVFEITMNSNSLDYHKRMTNLAQFVADVLNGRKSVSYDNDSKSYLIYEHLNAPEAPKTTLIPGLTQPLQMPVLSPLPVQATNGQEPSIAENEGFEPIATIVEKAKKRGRPPKK